MSTYAAYNNYGEGNGLECPDEVPDFLHDVEPSALKRWVEDGTLPRLEDIADGDPERAAEVALLLTREDFLMHRAALYAFGALDSEVSE